jgi:hypothetical protein
METDDSQNYDQENDDDNSICTNVTGDGFAKYNELGCRILSGEEVSKYLPSKFSNAFDAGLIKNRK